MDGTNEKERRMSEKLLHRECDKLSDEVKRLNSELRMQERRLENVMGLVSYKPPSLLPILSQSWFVVIGI